MAGYPLPENGGNVLLPYTTLKLSLRLPPPQKKAEPARAAVKAARKPIRPMTLGCDSMRRAAKPGWNAPTLAPWLEASLNRASNAALAIRRSPR
ncbi:MAG: hypothetical protein H6924_06680 [Alphaproteobacteria bacterium]|nr:hypothetical protein [Alphaproteobacteria bacterium]